MPVCYIYDIVVGATSALDWNKFTTTDTQEMNTMLSAGCSNLKLR